MPVHPLSKYIELLRYRGVTAGEACFFVPADTRVDFQTPHMLTLENNVKVASGAIILAHDHSRSVCINAFGVNVGDAGGDGSRGQRLYWHERNYPDGLHGWRRLHYRCGSGGKWIIPS